jgi:hypothetical protein
MGKGRCQQEQSCEDQGWGSPANRASPSRGQGSGQETAVESANANNPNHRG